MATISSAPMTTLKIRSFLGLNENPDGDTTLKVGELARMYNFRITRQGHLQLRPGTRTLFSLAGALSALGGDPDTAAVDGVWLGTVGRREHMLCAYGGHIWDMDLLTQQAVSKGEATAAQTSFFPFGDKVYLLNGHEYMSWDGGADTGFEVVEGYIPLIQTATTPAGGGTMVEPLNRLTGKRRVQFSPDGEAKTFQLPEAQVDEVCEVALLGSGVGGYTADLKLGTVTLASVPDSGTNTLTITYRKGTGSRGDVEGMRFGELFNGSTDARIFLYGDGTNRTIYSGIDYDTGQPSADYFPQLCEVAVGERNTPITGLIRHYSRLMAYKSGSTWVIRYGTMELEEGPVTAAFTVLPVNRQLGNDPVGQVRLLENDPLTVDMGQIYQWKASSSDGYASGSQSNAKPISQRVGRSLEEFDWGDIRTFVHKRESEYWFLCRGQALIFNYANNTWYRYQDLPFQALVEREDQTLGVCDDGRVVEFSRNHHSDDGAPIDAYAATGAMDFERDYQRKYSPRIYLAMQPETGARVEVSVESDRRSDYPAKVVAYNLAGFCHVDFRHFSFSTNRKPQVERVKMRVKKATFYRLIFRSYSSSATATILAADVSARYTGNVK